MRRECARRSLLQYEDDGVKNYPQSDFPKQMFIEFAEAWVGK